MASTSTDPAESSNPNQDPATQKSETTSSDPPAATDDEANSTSANPMLQKFYTPTMMLSSMNKTMASCGGSVELKKKLPDGTLISSTEGDRKAADMSAKLSQSAKLILSLPQDQKTEWAVDRRKVGNELFGAGKFGEAMEIYMTALVALAPALTSTSSEIEDSEARVQLPILLNLSACALNLGLITKAINFCDSALEIKSGIGRRSPKVWRRKGKALMRKGEYGKARESYLEGLACVSQRQDSSLSESF
jgi:tetratricopeptide (TPR) repeat protein